MDEDDIPDATIRLLGPIVLVRGDAVVTTRSALLRTLLALLALHAGSSVDAALITEELWGDALPQDPRAALHVLVARLRKWLSSASIDATVDHEHGGYALHVGHHAVDVFGFQDDARIAVDATDTATRLAVCERALARWRGEPFAGCVPGIALEIEAGRLRELRLQLVEVRCDALLAVGRHAVAIPELQALVAEHPLRERLAALAMLALYRDGRQREALGLFQGVRNALLDCGLEPGRDLADLERRILQQADELLAPAPAPASALPREVARRRPAIVGRADELDVVVRCLDGSLVLVSGEAGSGKSAFVRVAAHDAAERGARVAVAAWEGDRSPYAAWLSVLVQLGVDADELRARIGEPLTDVVRLRLRELARGGPVMVVLDDIHLADAASLAVVASLVDGGIPVGAGVVVTVRDPDATPRAEWLDVRAALARLDHVTELTLGPLGADDVLALVSREVGAEEAASLAAVVVERTGGNPLHVVALLDALGPHGAGAERTRVATDVPASLRHLVKAQLAALTSESRDIVESLAVLGPTSLDLLARVAGRFPLDAARLLRPAIELGLVVDADDVVEMRHAITADTVVESIPPSARAVLHRACLDQLDELGAEPFRRLRHARAAGSTVPRPRLASVELDAGRLAYDRGAHDEAVGLLESARAHLDGDRQRAATLHLGLARAALGDRVSADDLLDEVIAGASDDTDPDLLVTAAVGDELFGVQVRGDARLLARLRSVEELTRGSATSARARLLRALVAEERVALELERSAAALDELTRLAEELDSELERAHVASLRTREWLNDSDVPVQVQRARAEERYDAASKIGDQALRLDALEACVATAVMAGDLEHARDYLWELSREADRTRRPRSVWSAAVVDAALLHASGDDAASPRAEAASVLGTRLAIPDAIGALGAFVAVDRWRRGELHHVRAIADMAMDTYPGVAAWKAVAAAASAQAGERDDARRFLDEYVVARSAAGLRLFDKAGLAMAATAAAILDHRDAARAVRAALVPDDREVIIVGIGAAVLGPVCLYAGIVSAVLGERDVAAEHLDAARALATEAGWMPWADAAIHAGAALLGADPDATPYTLGLVRTG